MPEQRFIEQERMLARVEREMTTLDGVRVEIGQHVWWVHPNGGVIEHVVGGKFGDNFAFTLCGGWAIEVNRCYSTEQSARAAEKRDE